MLEESILYSNKCNYCGSKIPYPFVADTECAILMDGLQRKRDAAADAAVEKLLDH